MLAPQFALTALKRRRKQLAHRQQRTVYVGIVITAAIVGLLVSATVWFMVNGPLRWPYNFLVPPAALFVVLLYEVVIPLLSSAKAEQQQAIGNLHAKILLRHLRNLKSRTGQLNQQMEEWREDLVFGVLQVLDSSWGYQVEKAWRQRVSQQARRPPRLRVVK